MKPISISELKEAQRQSAQAAMMGMAEKLQAANDEIARLQAENDKLYDLLQRATTRLLELDPPIGELVRLPVVIEGKLGDGST